MTKPRFLRTARAAATALFAILTAAIALAAASAPRSFRFDFGPTASPVTADHTRVTPDLAYSAERGYGFDGGAEPTALDRDTADPLHQDFVTANGPFFFSVRLPEGNYRVTVTLGDPQGTSATTLKAESRRLLLENVTTAAGEFAARSFTVNIRTPAIAGPKDGTIGQVALKPREIGVLHWDDKLTLEFNGPRPCLAALEITPTPDALTVYLAGDSTVTDQPDEPWASWGQMLPRFFSPEVAIANHAESGLALSTFEGHRRFEKVLSTLRPGDYLFLQFGHNDQKEKGAGVGPFTTYKQRLKQFVAAALACGGRPVLVTSMHRRRFDDSGRIVDTHTDYAEAVRQVAREDDVPLIDLHAMSRVLFEALGPENSKRAFVHYPAGTFPNQPQPLKDDTHFNAYGAYELALCVVAEIRAHVPELAAHLAPDAPAFNPAHPAPLERFNLPLSPPRPVVLTKPDGS